MYCLYIMEKIPSIVILICKIWKKFYCLFHILHNNVDSMENSKKSDRILNSGSWIRFDRPCGITTTPIESNKPIAIGSCAISGPMWVRPIPGRCRWGR